MSERSDEVQERVTQNAELLGHAFDSEFEIWILSFNFQIALRETARRVIWILLDFDVPPYMLLVCPRVLPAIHGGTAATVMLQ